MKNYKSFLVWETIIYVRAYPPPKTSLFSRHYHPAGKILIFQTDNCDGPAMLLPPQKPANRLALVWRVDPLPLLLLLCFLLYLTTATPSFNRSH